MKRRWHASRNMVTKQEKGYETIQPVASLVIVMKVSEGPTFIKYVEAAQISRAVIVLSR
jgi:hypothetical protein